MIPLQGSKVPLEGDSDLSGLGVLATPLLLFSRLTLRALMLPLQSSRVPLEGDADLPGPGAYEAGRAFVLFCVRRAPSAGIHEASEETSALSRRRWQRRWI